MAITQRDYKPGVFEAFSGVDLGNPTIGVSAYFVLDGYWKFDVADVVLRADSAAGPVLAAGVDYTLLEDEKYTELEANYTGKTLYAKYTIVNAAYTGRPIFAEGNNFGSMMSNEDTKQYIDDNSGGGVQDFIDLNPSLVADPSATEGRFFYNNFERSIQIFTNNPNYWNIPGQADFVRVLNGTGAPITRGQNLDVRGVGASEGRLVLTAFSTDACDIANNDNKGWAILVATEDIPAGDSGIACFGGTLLNVDTSGLTPGAPVYLGASGEWTNTRPSGCAKYVLIGTAIVADASIGVMGIRVTVDDYDPEFDATVLERQEYAIVEGTGGDAGKLFCEVWNKEDVTRDLPIPIGGTTYQLNTTTGPGTSGRARVELIQGTATSAQFNYVYVYENAGVAELAVTAGYPSPPFAVIGRVSCWDATRFATDGVLANRRTTSAKVVADRGILSYIIERLGVLPPWVFSGCTPTASIAANVMNLVSASGVVYQTLRQAMPQLEVITDGFYIANGPGGAGLANNVKLTDVKEAAGYTTVDAARNTSCTGSLVFYLLINKEQSECKIMCNLPGGLDGTNTASGLRTYQDDKNAAVYSGTEETAFTEFSLCRIPYRFTGGVIQFLDPNGAGTTDGQYIINRINQPMGSAGGSGGGGGALQNLLQVLAEGNSAGGQQIKDLANATDGQDALPKAQADTLYTVAGHTHTGAGGSDGGVIDHDNLNNIGSVPHANLDLHFNDANFFHDHVNLQNAGTNTHAQIDAALAALGDYLKRDGSLPMTGDLSMSRKDILDVYRVASDDAHYGGFESGGIKFGYIGVGCKWMDGSNYVSTQTTYEPVLFQIDGLGTTKARMSFFKAASIPSSVGGTISDFVTMFLVDGDGTLSLPDVTIPEVTSDPKNVITLEAGDARYNTRIDSTGLNLDTYFTPSEVNVTSATGTLPTAETDGYLNVYLKTSVDARQVWRTKGTTETWERLWKSGTGWNAWTLSAGHVRVTSATDLNNVILQGVYSVAVVPTNRPPLSVSSGGMLEVKRYYEFPNTVQQTWWDTDDKVWVRQNTGSGWGDWSLTNGVEIITLAGGTDLNTVTTPGHYYCATPTNSPATSLFIDVYNAASGVRGVQIAYSPLDASPVYYIRYQAAGSFVGVAWKQMGTDQGPTANRPTTNLHIGLSYFDTSLNKPIWHNGTNWVDATGATV